MKKFFIAGVFILILCFASGCRSGVDSTPGADGSVPPINWTLSSHRVCVDIDFSSDDPDDFDFEIFGVEITYGNGKFVVGGLARGEDGYYDPEIWFSTDRGKTWNKGACPYDTYHDLEYSRKTVPFVAALGFGGGTYVSAIGGHGFLSSSNDLVNWNKTEDYMGRKYSAGYFTYGNGTFVYSGYKAGSLKYSIDKGRSWKDRDDKLDDFDVAHIRGSSITYGDGLFYGFARGGYEDWENKPDRFGLATSVDAINWTSIAMEEGDDGKYYQFYEGTRGILAYGDGVLVATNNHYYYERYPYLSYSTNKGVTWVPAICDPKLGDGAFIHKIVYGNGYFVAVGMADQDNGLDIVDNYCGKIWYSDNMGKSWKEAKVDLEFDYFWNASFGDNTFVIVSDKGKIYYSNVK